MAAASTPARLDSEALAAALLDIGLVRQLGDGLGTTLDPRQ